MLKHLISSVTDEDDKIPPAGNTWSITKIGEVYEIQMHDLSMSVWLRW